MSVAFPYAAVGPEAVGGAEVLCTRLERAISSLGHSSVVVAHADSRPAGKLYPTIVPGGTITDETRTVVERAHQRNIERALAENDVALVHMHGFDFHRYTVPEQVPVLVTLHLPPSWYPESVWSLPRNYHFVCVSENQRAASPAAVQHRLRVIPNGVDLPDAALLREHGRYALMLARICPEKNIHTGLDAARLAGMPALLGGAVFPYETHEQYFTAEISPRLTVTGLSHEKHLQGKENGATARFLGPVSGSEKARLLSRAACLLLPSLAPETSSLVAMEALAYGVPVIAMAVGAVPEIVEHGRTGLLIEPGQEAVLRMVDAIRSLPLLDRKVCRAVAEERFAWSRTRDAYAAIFRELTSTCPPILPDANLSSTSSGPVPATEQETPPVRELLVGQITSGDKLHALATEWIALWRSDMNATPFQHPAWLLPWWEQFGPDGDLYALTLRAEHDGPLSGFLPLYYYRQPGTGKRKLLIMGAGTTDYLDGLWRSAQDWAAQRALTYVKSHLAGWDELSLDQIRQDSPLARAASHLSLRLELGEPVSTLDLAEDLPPKIRTNIRRYRRLAESQGVLRCEVVSSADGAHAAFEELVKLHGERWQGRQEPGVLQDSRVLAHHRATLPLLLEAGLLCMFQLRLEEQTIGVLYGLIDSPHVRERRLYLYLIGFASQFAALSPGTLLLDEAYRFAARHACSKVDLLRGGERYKELWGAHTEQTLALRSEPGSPDV